MDVTKISPVSTDGPVTIVLSEEERQTGNLTPLHLYDAVDALRNDGIVVLENAIPVDVCDKLNERVVQDAETLLKRNKNLHWGQGKGSGNLSVPLPFEKDYIFPEIYGNKAAAKVISHVVGPHPEVRFVNSNTTIPGQGKKQPVHKDGRFLHPTHPYCIAMNATLIDVGPENGATELWLGTNNSSPPTDWVEPGNSHIRLDHLDPRRSIRPPIQPRVKKGGIMLRDLRVWHCGVPNTGDQMRVMIVLLYFASWFGNDELVQMPSSLKPTIEALAASNGTKFCAEWIEDDAFVNLDARFNHDFSSKVHPEFWEPYREFSEARMRMLNPRDE